MMFHFPAISCYQEDLKAGCHPRPCQEEANHLSPLIEHKKLAVIQLITGNYLFQDKKLYRKLKGFFYKSSPQFGRKF